MSFFYVLELMIRQQVIRSTLVEGRWVYLRNLNTSVYSSRIIPFSLEERNVEIFNITPPPPHGRKGTLVTQLISCDLARVTKNQLS